MSSALPASWDVESDVVVLGSGAAALSAAGVAAAEGASVTVLEKSELIGGTTSMSGGGAWIPMNDHMAEEGVEDSREEALAYVRACAGDAGDDEIFVSIVDRGAEMIRYLESRLGMSFRAWPSVGGTIDYRPWLPGAKHGGRTLHPAKFRLADLGEWAAKLRLGPASAWSTDPLDYYRNRLHLLAPDQVSTPPHTQSVRDEAIPIEYLASGAGLVGQLLRGCIAQGVDIRLEAPGQELLTEDGRVVGVRALKDGGPFFARARRGVVVATGGYGKNEDLKRLWMSRPLDFTCDIEPNQGDGHLMGMAIGAQMADLGDAWWMPQLAGIAAAVSVNIAGSREDRHFPHTLMVNRYGRRFVNESLNYHDVCEGFGLKEGGMARNVPAWLVFDTQAITKYAGLAWRIPKGPPPDYLYVADTLEGLAAQLGVEPGALRETVERFNGFARDGIDHDFHRGESKWDIAWGDDKNKPNPSLGALERGPFYALEVKPGALATKGGLRINGRGEVLSAAPPFGPIPGLSAAGNCSNGSVPGAYVGGGATIGPALTFGYVIGMRLAQDTDVPVVAGDASAVS